MQKQLKPLLKRLKTLAKKSQSLARKIDHDPNIYEQEHGTFVAKDWDDGIMFRLNDFDYVEDAIEGIDNVLCNIKRAKFWRKGHKGKKEKAVKMLDCIMDNCSFLKKDIDCALMHSRHHLYVFKYAILSSDGKEIRTTKACEGGKSMEEAEPLARDLVRKLVESDYSGQNVKIKLLKWIQLESEY